MDLEGEFLDLERALLHSLPKSGDPWPLLPPGSYVSGHFNVILIAEFQMARPRIVCILKERNATLGCLINGRTLYNATCDNSN